MTGAWFNQLEHEIIESSDDPAFPFRRHIFYTVDLQKEETIFLEELDKVLRFDEPLPPAWWVDADSLRFVYEFD